MQEEQRGDTEMEVSGQLHAHAGQICIELDSNAGGQSPDGSIPLADTNIDC
jgi:hypothetical protein